MDYTFIILARHAQSAERQVHRNQTDAERELTSTGVKQAVSGREWLKQNSLNPDRALVSPAKRTLQTALELLKDRPLEPQILPELYNASAATLYKALLQAGSATNILIVAHNPGISDLCSQLTDDDYHFTPGQMVVLKRSVEGNAELFIEQLKFIPA